MMKSYAPYDNVGRARIPTSSSPPGSRIPVSGYWEPAKWVQKLRAADPDAAVLLKVELDAGHGGPSGRYAGLARRGVRPVVRPRGRGDRGLRVLRDRKVMSNGDWKPLGNCHGRAVQRHGARRWPHPSPDGQVTRGRQRAGLPAAARVPVHSTVPVAVSVASTQHDPEASSTTV